MDKETLKTGLFIPGSNARGPIREENVLLAQRRKVPDDRRRPSWKNFNSFRSLATTSENQNRGKI